MSLGSSTDSEDADVVPKQDARSGVSRKAELLGRGAVWVEPGRKDRGNASHFWKRKF